MDIHGTTNIAASPEMVWDALNDPVVLAQCVDGCDSFGQVGPGEFAATGSLKVGPVRSRIAVNITFAESEPPDRAVLKLNARGAMGRAEAIATIHLIANNGGTTLTYSATAKLGGQLGRFAGRWAGDAVQQLVGNFFARFAAAIPASPIPVATAPTAARPPAAPPMQKPSISPQTTALWIGIGAAAGAAITATAAILLSRNRPR
jgi:uncharacterized protein